MMVFLQFYTIFFFQKIKIYAFINKKASASGGLCPPPDPLPGLCPLLGDFCPPDP